MFPNGLSVEADQAEALRWCRLAAEQGLDAAQANLGLMYARGLGCEIDYVEARRWYLAGGGARQCRGRTRPRRHLRQRLRRRGRPGDRRGLVREGRRQGQSRRAGRAGAAVRCRAGRCRAIRRGPPRCSNWRPSAAIRGPATISRMHLLEGNGVPENRVMAETHLRQAAHDRLRAGDAAARRPAQRQERGGAVVPGGGRYRRSRGAIRARRAACPRRGRAAAGRGRGALVRAGGRAGTRRGAVQPRDLLPQRHRRRARPGTRPRPGSPGRPSRA